MQTVTLYHGTDGDDIDLRPGLCLAWDYAAAAQYGSKVFAVELPAELVARAVEAPAYDAERDFAPGDSLGVGGHLVEEWAGLDECDVITYDDSCLRLSHRTVRLISDAAIDAVLAVSQIA